MTTLTAWPPCGLTPKGDVATSALQSRVSFCPAGRIVAVAILKRSTGFRDKLRAALLDEIASLVNYTSEDFDEFAYAGFPVD